MDLVLGDLPNSIYSTAVLCIKKKKGCSLVVLTGSTTGPQTSWARDLGRWACQIVDRPIGLGYSSVLPQRDHFCTWKEKGARQLWLAGFSYEKPPLNLRCTKVTVFEQGHRKRTSLVTFHETDSYVRCQRQRVTAL
jgi:hypothetical protein